MRRLLASALLALALPSAALAAGQAAAPIDQSPPGAGAEIQQSATGDEVNTYLKSDPSTAAETTPASNRSEVGTALVITLIVLAVGLVGRRLGWGRKNAGDA